MDDIVRLALNKCSNLTDNTNLEREDSLKMNVLMEKSNLKDIH